MLKLLFSDVGPCIVKPGSAAIPAVWSFVQRKVFPGFYFCLPVSKFCLSVQAQSAAAPGCMSAVWVKNRLRTALCPR